MTTPVKQLSTDLSKLKSLQSKETKALASVKTQESQIIKSYQTAPSLTAFKDAAARLVALGAKEEQLREHYDPSISKAKKAALKDLPKAAPSLSLKTLNADRKVLGLKPVTHTPAPAYGEPWKKGKGQLEGGDTSHYQSQATFEKSIAHSQFAAIKATEGTKYVDPEFKKRWAELGKKVDSGKMSLRMAYLFLDKGNGTAQAKHFLDTLGIKGKLKPGTRLALDWEAGALSSPQTLKDAANYIHKVTGLWPVIYTSGSQVSRAKAAVPHAPLWAAQWTGGKANHDVPFVQYSDGPGYDHDVFNGGTAALRKFAGF